MVSGVSMVEETGERKAASTAVMEAGMLRLRKLCRLPWKRKKRSAMAHMATAGSWLLPDQ